ncbi:MAG: N-acetylmuramoyl-L-alanine amidase [Nocardioides sp.]
MFSASRPVRFVTGCQQLLVLGAVLAALTPAAGVVSLEIVARPPAGSGPSRPAGAPVARMESAQVPLRAVDPTVREYALTAPRGASRQRPVAALASTTTAPDGAVQLVSMPTPVSGYGAVGLSWAPRTRLTQADAAFSVRTRVTGGEWSAWQTLPYDPEHGPDPKSDEAEHARPGTDPLLVGDVDEVQVRADLADRAPTDLSLAVIDPGTDGATEQEAPALDTGAGDPEDSGAALEVQPEGGTKATAGSGLALQAATFTPKPRIFSRAQWGADESMRDASSLHYYEVHAGFVHHTVNANDYTRAEVPALIRGIYAYHVRVRGWSDIGYNFLVDRFGRIWEGRYGGIDRPVVGAHTLGYNDYSFAMSAIGNFETTQPRPRMLRAYGALFAWKLSLHGVDASSTRQKVGSSYFQAINGHRDAAATACPGRYLYAQLPLIRTYAAEDQQGWAGRELESNLAGNRYPDLIVRRASDGQAFVLPTGGMLRFTKAKALLNGWAAGDVAVASPDLTGDGRGDVLVRGPTASPGSTPARAAPGWVPRCGRHPPSRGAT